MVFFQEKYPAPTPNNRNLVVSVAFGVFISFFLYFFEPFGIDRREKENSLFYLLGFGGITTFVLVLFLYFLPLRFPSYFSDSRWTVGHQILFCLIILFVIATLNGLYTNYMNELPFSWTNYWWIISRTFVLGFIPFSFLILIDVRLKNHHHQEMAKGLLKQTTVEDQPLPSAVRTLTTDLKNETITFRDQDFSHAVADGNYIDLYTRVDDSCTSTTYRITLAAFEQQLDGPHLQRCHRSYLVNLHQVLYVSGNAQGLRLTMADYAEEIPVSRKYVSAVKGFFSNNPNHPSAINR